MIDLAPCGCEWVWGGDGAAGRTRRPFGVCVFRLADRSARLFLPVRMGGVSVFQLGTPLAPGRARTKSIGYIRLDPDDPR